MKTVLFFELWSSQMFPDTAQVSIYHQNGDIIDRQLIEGDYTLRDGVEAIIRNLQQRLNYNITMPVEGIVNKLMRKTFCFTSV